MGFFQQSHVLHNWIQQYVCVCYIGGIHWEKIRPRSHAALFKMASLHKKMPNVTSQKMHKSNCKITKTLSIENNQFFLKFDFTNVSAIKKSLKDKLMHTS